MSERVMEGAEPFRFEGGDVGVLVSHGFTGTTQSVSPLGEALAREGFTVEGPRLAGHGTSVSEMAGSTAQDWISSLEEGLAWLEERTRVVFVCGLSMGGTLSHHLGATHPEVVRGVIPINGCVFLGNPELARIVLSPDAPPTLPGVGSDIKKAGVEELVYDEMPVPAMKELMALMRATDDLLPEVRCPALILQSTEDHVVPPDNGPYFLEKVGSEHKELVRLEDSYHVATLDNDAPRIAELAADFIREHGG